MDDVKNLISSMTLEEKIGQLFHIGFQGTGVTEDIKKMIREYHIGGIIYFRRNIESLEQVASLSNGLQGEALKQDTAIPLLISIDQEGGTVTRLKGATHFPGNMSLGATGSAELAARAGKGVACELKALGINMNLAPVLDVNNNPNNPVIGVRSFGEDPALVALLGSAYIKGLQYNGVVACGKHFPGHGDTDTDSHLDLPVIKHDRNRLEEIELYPFKEAIKQGLDSIMTAHVYFPAIESSDGKPATLSSNVLTALLREEMEYDGIIITDCLEMNAIVNTYGTVKAAVMTIEAGSDMVLISHTIEKAQQAIEAVIAAVKEGRISEERIEESVMRILKLKAKRIKDPLVNIGDFSKEEGRKIAEEIASRAVTLLKNDKNLIPLTKENSRVLVCDFKMNRVTLVEDERKVNSPLVEYFKSEGIDVDYHIIKEKVEFTTADKYDLVVVCTYNLSGDNRQLELIKILQQSSNPYLVLALRNPYDLRVIPEVGTFLTTYDYSPANIEAVGKVILGKLIAQGELPVTI